MDDVGGLDTVQDHVHDRDDVGEGFLLLAIEGAGLQGFELTGGEFFLPQIVVGLTQKARRPDCAVVDALTEFGLGHLDHGADQWARGVVFAAVAPGVAHVFDLRFIQV